MEAASLDLQSEYNHHLSKLPLVAKASTLIPDWMFLGLEVDNGLIPICRINRRTSYSFLLINVNHNVKHQKHDIETMIMKIFTTIC